MSSIFRATPTERWSFVNALGMLLATGVSLTLERSWPLLVGLGFLIGLIIMARGHWTPRGRFGWSNAVTAARTSTLVLFPALAAKPLSIVVLSLLFLLADGLDGWLARRNHSASLFGAFFDKEADALFVLLLCTIAVLKGRLPLWMIGTGLLRYGFVIAVFVLDPPQKTEKRFNWARYVHGGMVGTLLLVFWTSSPLTRACAYLAAAALIVSFGYSFQHLLSSTRSA